MFAVNRQRDRANAGVPKQSFPFGYRTTTLLYSYTLIYQNLFLCFEDMFSEFMPEPELT